MKSYIILAAQTYSEENPSEDDVEYLKHCSNWFLSNDDSKDFKIYCINLEKNFITLCSVMEGNGSSNPSNYTIQQFYGKIDYLKAQSEKYEQQSNKA